MIAIRWLGAFGKGSNFSDSLTWELEINRREVAAAWWDDGYYFTGIHHSRVGLLLEKGAVIRRFNGDVWSEVQGDRLVPSRPSCHSTRHNECFCKPHYRGIVVTVPLDQMSPKIRRPLVAMARKHSLPIYMFNHNSDDNNLTKIIVHR